MGSKVQNYRFVFVVGAAGSGTTVLMQLLGRVPGGVALGGNYISIPSEQADARARATAFNQAADILWDRRADAPRAWVASQRMVDCIEELRRLPHFESTSHYFYKRSFPFYTGDRYRPDLSDLFVMFDQVRLVVIYRDPRASAASMWRRRFGHNLRNCAVITEEQLTYIAAQLSTFDSGSLIRIRYEDLCQNPREILTQLGTFCNFDTDELLRSPALDTLTTDRKDRWRQELRPEETAFLDGFFDARRLSQWNLLSHS